MAKLDIRELVASKAPKAAKYIPSFIYRWVEKILHLGEVNDILESGWDLTPHEFLRHYFTLQSITYTVEGLEGLDPNGRYLFASNHPFGGMDGMMIADMMIEKFGDARVVVNDLLMNLKPLTPIWVPVNTLGSQNAEYAKKFEEAFAGDKPILTFPAGLCSRVFDGKIADPKWKNTFVRRAHSSGRTIVPLFMSGKLAGGFYRLYKIRKALGIKANIEMFLLPDGMFRQKGRHFRIALGKPITPEELSAIGSVGEQTEYIRRRVYEMS
ncbi:MAG: acyltransferase [Rikenellaceae bacterium]